MDVYQTNYNGIFVGVTVADPDPMDADNWLIPAGCVTVAPPELANGEFAAWDGEAWHVQTPPEPEPAPEPLTIEQIRNGSSLSKIEFCRALYGAQILPADMVAKTAMGEFPAQFRAALAGMSEAQVVDAELAWAGAVSVNRMAPLFLSLLSFYGQQAQMTADVAVAFGDQIFGIVL